MQTMVGAGREEQALARLSLAIRKRLPWLQINLGTAFLGPAMIFSMTMAGMTGALIPIVLTALGRDPAQSASIVLTTVTDVMGFLSFLGLAYLLADVFGVISP